MVLYYKHNFNLKTLLKMNVNDFLRFRKMITPVVIQILFWIGVAASVIFGFYTMFSGSFLSGLGMVVLGPVGVRIWCELLIVIFSINDSLTDIRRAKLDQSKASNIPTE